MNFKEIFKKYGTVKDVILFAAGLAFGFFLVYKMMPTVDLKPYEDKIIEQADLLRLKQLKIDKLDLVETTLLKELEKVNVEYADFRNKAITDKQTDSLQLEEIRKGIAKYGRPVVSQKQAALASSYGNNAFDDLTLTEGRLQNQMKVSLLYAEVVLHKDTIIMNQTVIIKEVKKNFTKSNIKWFFGGGFIGFILSMFIFI